MIASPPTLLPLLFTPKEAVRYFSSPHVSHLRLIFSFSFLYSILLILVYSQLCPMDSLPILINSCLFCLLFAPIFYGWIGILTFGIWKMAKFLKGGGTLHTTRAALLVAMLYGVPMLFFLSLCFHETVGWLLLALVGICATLSYSFWALLKVLSLVHNFSLWRAFFAFSLGIFLGFLSPGAASRFWFRDSHDAEDSDAIFEEDVSIADDGGF